MRIAIVNDQMIAIEAMRRVLVNAPQHSVAWIARDGADAVQRCAADTPDLILMDLLMPLMDGVEATRRIMATCPCPILIVTATVHGRADRVFEAIGAGALDAVNTPTLGPEDAALEAGLLAKIALIAQLAGAPAAGLANGHCRPRTRAGASACALIAIGSSAGGPAALAEILRELPAGFPAAVVVIQHLDEQFADSLAAWLGQQIALPVRIARDGEAPAPGTVLMAGRGAHLILDAAQALRYSMMPAENSYRPSVDVFFESVATVWRDQALGVILTGMGRDGAVGLKKMRESGFSTLAQDQASCAVYGMPKAAAELGAALAVLPLTQIGGALRRFASGHAQIT